MLRFEWGSHCLFFAIICIAFGCNYVFHVFNDFFFLHFKGTYFSSSSVFFSLSSFLLLTLINQLFILLIILFQAFKYFFYSLCFLSSFIGIIVHCSSRYGIFFSFRHFRLYSSNFFSSLQLSTVIWNDESIKYYYQ